MLIIWFLLEILFHDEGSMYPLISTLAMRFRLLSQQKTHLQIDQLAMFTRYVHGRYSNEPTSKALPQQL